MSPFPVSRLASVLALASFALATPAVRAQDPDGDVEPTLVVFEIYYTGQKFEKTPEYSQKVEERIAKMGGFSVVSRADAEKSIMAKIPPSADAALGDKADEIRGTVKEAEDIFFQQGPDAALDKLRSAREQLQRIVESLSLSEEIRKEYVSTQMLLALIYIRSNKPDKAEEVMDELVQRVGEDRTINEDNYHPDAVALYRARYASLSAKRVGKITVRTDPPGADIYINGLRQDRKAPATFEGLFPGKVLIQAKSEGRQSRVKEVKIEEGVEATLEIDLNFESSLAFGAKRFGLEFQNDLDRKRNLPAFAAKLGDIVSADYIAFVGLAETDGKSNLVGYLVRAETDQLVRGTEMFTRTNVISKSRVEQMAVFIVYGDKPEVVYKPWAANPLGWVLTGVGVAGGVVGTVMYMGYQDDRKIAECVPPGGDQGLGDCVPEAERRDAKDSAETSRTVAYASWGVGAASLIGGVLAFALMREEDPDAPVKPRVPGAAKTGLKMIPPAPMLAPNTVGVSTGFTF